MSIWSQLADQLVATELGVPVIYQPQGLNDVDLRAILGQPDQEAELGRMRVRQSTVRIEVRITDLDRPLRRDRFILDGVIYAVAGDAPTDESGVWWLITGNRVAEAA